MNRPTVYIAMLVMLLFIYIVLLFLNLLCSSIVLFITPDMECFLFKKSLSLMTVKHSLNLQTKEQIKLINPNPAYFCVLLVVHCVNRKPQAVCCHQMGNLKMLNYLPLVAKKSGNTELPSSSSVFLVLFRAKEQRDASTQTQSPAARST